MARIAITFEDTDTGVAVVVRHENPVGETPTPAEKAAASVQKVLALLGELTNAD